MKNLKILFICIMVVLLIISLTACMDNGSATDGGEEKNNSEASSKVELKLSYPNSETSLTGQAYTYFAQAVNEESNGEVTISLYPSGSLVGNTEILAAVQEGNVDIGHFVTSYISPTIKEMTPFEVPGAYPGTKYFELDEAAHEIIDRIFSKYGVKYIAPTNQDTSAFATKGKMIKSPDDINGLKVRASGKWIGEAVKNWGGSAVTIPLGDVPMALERGAVDSAYTGWQIVGPFKLYESAPNVTFTELQEIFGGLMMSQKTWDKLSEEQQDAIMRAADRFMKYDYDLAQEMKNKVISDIEEADGTVYYLTDEENQVFIDMSVHLLEQVKDISGPEGTELIEAFNSIK